MVVSTVLSTTPVAVAEPVDKPEVALFDPMLPVAVAEPVDKPEVALFDPMLPVAVAEPVDKPLMSALTGVVDNVITPVTGDIRSE